LHPGYKAGDYSVGAIDVIKTATLGSPFFENQA